MNLKMIWNVVQNVECLCLNVVVMGITWWWLFEKKEDSLINKVYLDVMFFGGDADTRHPERYDLTKKYGITYTNYTEHIDKIEELVNNFETLKKALELDSYDEVKDEYGEEIARMYDNTPNDPQCDYQFKCHLDYIKLTAYDEQGNRHESWV